ncbi:DUF3060 domain-containing protein [Xanthomonas medicagonis]|uniref:DUF3060 domain-containing protein n=1 Tax=Xanthomonas medicagonis TaxID=3160841 RepID=UPI00351895FF
MKHPLLFSLSLLALAGCTRTPRPPDGPGAGDATRTVVMSAAAPPTAALSTSASEDGARDTESGIRMTPSDSGEIDCDGRDLNIVGRDASLVLRGHCATVSLFGRNGNLQIDQADTLRILGDNAQVALRGDVGTVALFGRQARLQTAGIATLEVSGDQNQLHATEIGSIALQGSDNAIVQRTGSAQVSDGGRDNRVLRQ